LSDKADPSLNGKKVYEVFAEMIIWMITSGEGFELINSEARD